MKRIAPSLACLFLTLGAACSDSTDSNAVSGDGGAGGNGDGSINGGGNTDGGGDADAARPPVVIGAPGTPVKLGTSANFVILSKTGISSVPPSVITGDIGVSPVAATFITGFSLSADASNVFSTTTQVTGKVYAADYAVPTPATLTTAVGDMEDAFADAAGRAPDVTELNAGDIGGKTLTKGVYQWSTGLLIPTDVTLTGSATDVWVFQIAQDLTMASGVKVVLAGGALPKNVFWEVAGGADLDTNSHIEGTIVCQTAISLKTGSSINGRLLAQTAVTLAGSTVVQAAQ